MELKLSTTTIVAIVLFAAIVLRAVTNRRRTPNAPGIGYGRLPIIGRWQGVLTFMKDPNGTMARGCAQFKYFRVTTHSVEYVIVADKKKIAEYLAAPDDVLNFHDQINEFLQTEWTLGYGVAHRPYHISLVRTKLTQSIAASVPSMMVEIEDAMNTQIGSPKEWTEVKLYDVMVKIAARASNNAFTGLLFCRNETYLGNAIAYAQMVVVSAELIRVVPTFLKPLVAMLTPYRRIQKQARELMGPLVQKRLEGKWKEGEKPNDMIQILIDAAPEEEQTMPQIVERMMTLNMASIHTTSMTITTIIYHLAAEPEKYIPPLRAEILEHMVDGKVDKLALGKMAKLDSFMRECGRVEPLGIISSVRQARKDFTFSDGMVIPAGANVAAPIFLMHNEASDLPDPNVFDGFRYSRMNEEATGPTKYQMVNTDLNFLLFGHGRHACPGRFLAVAEMKLILINLLLHYDLKLISGTMPKSRYFGTARIPELRLPILMKAVS